MTSGERDPSAADADRPASAADSVPVAVRLAVQRARTVVAPEDRVSPFAVECELDGSAVVLTGVVGDTHARRTVVAEVERAAGDRRVRHELSVLAGSGVARTTDRRVVPVRGAPSADAEQVTQALFGDDLLAYDGRDGWRRVRTSRGYVGWVADDSLVEPAGRGGDWAPDAVVARTTDGPSDDGVPGSVPAGTSCRLESVDGTSATVSFRTGASATFAADRLRRRRPVADGQAVVDAARQFLGTPYEWGGMTVDGIDCSGLTSIAYAVAGLRLPRDADQQEHLGVAVDREALEPGDLLFWPGHVGISIGGDEYVHASGSAGEVTISSFDPDDGRYEAELDETLRSTKRLLDGTADDVGSTSEASRAAGGDGG